MPRRKQHLVYYFDDAPPMRYLVTADGDGAGVGSQKWSLRIESASPGKPFCEMREATGSLDCAHEFVAQILDQRNPGFNQKEWKDYVLKLRPPGPPEGNNLAIVAMAGWIKDVGYDKAKELIANRNELERIALCGGYDEAMATLEFCGQVLNEE